MALRVVGEPDGVVVVIEEPAAGCDFFDASHVQQRLVVEVEVLRAVAARILVGADPAFLRVQLVAMARSFLCLVRRIPEVVGARELREHQRSAENGPVLALEGVTGPRIELLHSMDAGLEQESRVRRADVDDVLDVLPWIDLDGFDFLRVGRRVVPGFGTSAPGQGSSQQDDDCAESRYPHDGRVAWELISLRVVASS